MFGDFFLSIISIFIIYDYQYFDQIVSLNGFNRNQELKSNPENVLFILDYSKKSYVCVFKKTNLDNFLIEGSGGRAIVAKPPWTSEIYWFQGVFMPQRVLSPPWKEENLSPPWTNSWICPWKEQSVISSDASYKDGNARLTTIPFKHLSDQ